MYKASPEPPGGCGRRTPASDCDLLGACSVAPPPPVAHHELLAGPRSSPQSCSLPRRWRCRRRQSPSRIRHRRARPRPAQDQRARPRRRKAPQPPPLFPTGPRRPARRHLRRPPRRPPRPTRRRRPQIRPGDRPRIPRASSGRRPSRWQHPPSRSRSSRSAARLPVSSSKISAASASPEPCHRRAMVSGSRSGTSVATRSGIGPGRPQPMTPVTTASTSR